MSHLSVSGPDISQPSIGGIGGRMLAVLKWIGRAGRAFNGRRMIADLGRLDDRMLRDIGLSRSDLRDAASVSPLEDPTVVLFRRAAERRRARERGSNADRVVLAAGRNNRKRIVPYY